MEGIELKNISFSYDNKNEILKNLSFTLEKGELAALIGPNGSGKSTLLKLSSGILSPLEGEVRVFGNLISKYSPKERASLVSYLPQIIDMDVSFTVREIASMGQYHGKNTGLTIEEALSITGLSDKAQRKVFELSGGERRRAFLAMMLVQGAKTLLLDEPLTNLDIKYQLELINLIKKMTGMKNSSAIVAIHDINLVRRFEKVCVMKDGKIKKIGPPCEVLTEDLIKEVFEVSPEDLYGRQG
ncbi:MAG: ABC transporter ATP-binding protein [Thermodesulfobacteriota bacterium]